MEYSSIIETEAEYTLENPVIVSAEETPLEAETLIIDDISSVDDVTPNEPINASIPIIDVNPNVGDVDNGDPLDEQESNTTISENPTVDNIYTLLLERLPKSIESESESEPESESESESESEFTLRELNITLDKLYTLESEQFALIEKNQVSHDTNSNMYSDYSVSVLIAVFGAVIASLFFKRF